MYINILHDSHKFRCTWAISEDWHHDTRMSTGRETTLHHSGLVRSVEDSHTAGFMIGSNHHQCFAVACGKLERLAHRLVKVEHLFNHLYRIVAMSARIDKGAFHHQ